VAENNLELRADGSTAARATGEKATIAVDTLIFAIGDKHDPLIGLPMGRDGYATRPGVDQTSQPSFEVWDPAAGDVLAGRFVAGWARLASTGLVGIARHDGELGANKAIEFVKNAPDSGTLDAGEVQARLDAKGLRTVSKQDLELLTQAEQREAAVQGVGTFKFADDEAMFKAIADERERVKAAAAAEASQLASAD
jgi:ferredoxin--NADP+ reductase